MDYTDTLVNTSERILNGQEEIIFAYRNEEGDLYLFGKSQPGDPELLVKEVPVKNLIEKHPEITEILDIPSGHVAYKNKKMSSWKTMQYNKNTGMGDYLDGHFEWINKMYVKGYFTGGNIPNWYFNPGKPRLFGILSVIMACLSLLTSILLLILSDGRNWKNALVPFIFSAFFLAVGWRLLNKKSSG